jgi:putative pyruvate formate lyase activating enzyme
LLIRHLVIPGDVAGTREVLRWIAQELSPTTFVNVMGQYYPAGKVSRTEFPEIYRRLTVGEYARALTEAQQAGLTRLDYRAHFAMAILEH